MNRKSVIGIGIAGLLAASGAQANVVPDPGFENSSWSRQDGTMTFVPSPVRTGAQSLQVVNVGSGNHNAISPDAIGLVPGHEYTFSAFVKGENVFPANLADAGQAPLAVVRFKNAAGTLLNSGGKTMEGYRWAQVKTNNQPNNGTYNFQSTNMQMNMQVPQGGARADFSVRTWWVPSTGAGTLSGTTWWDDISFTQRVFPDRGTKLLTLEAENANTQQGGHVDDHHFDFSGTGYYDIIDPASSTTTTTTGRLIWENVPGTGTRILAVRYAWEGIIQEIKVYVNNVERGAATPLPTGRRGIFATQDFEVNLPNATNTIRLDVKRKGTSEKIAPMVDRIDVFAKAAGGPPPAIPGGVSASDDTFTDKVQVDWNAVSGASNYQVFRSTTAGVNGSQIGTPAGNTFNDTTAVAETIYHYSVTACNGGGCSLNSSQDQGSRAVGGGGGGDGSLTSSVDLGPPAVVSLTAVGTADWAHVGDGPRDDKAGVTQQIGEFVGFGGAEQVPHNASKIEYEWTDGTLTPNQTGTKTGFAVFDAGRGYEFDTPAETTPRTLRIYTTFNASLGTPQGAKIVATLSDDSAPPVTVDMSLASGKKNRVVTLTYKAASDGQILHVRFEKTTNKPGFASFDAVALSGGSGSGLDLPPTMTTIPDQNVIEGDLMSVGVTGEDPEGTEVTFSQTSIPGSPTVNIIDLSGSAATIEWTPGAADVGTNTIGITATDETGAISSQTFDVVVEPIDGGEPGSLDIPFVLDAANPVLLDAQGPIDWVKYGTAQVRKAGTPVISDASSLLGSALIGANGTNKTSTYTWTGGTPTAAGSSNAMFRNFVVNDGFSVTVPASTTLRRLKLYVSLKDAQAEVQATLSDGSAPPEVWPLTGTSNTKSRVVVIDFKAGAAGQTMTVTFKKTVAADNAWVGLEGAALE